MQSTVILAEWNYDNASPNGPSNWWRENSNCSGRRQSPINLDWFSTQLMLTSPKVTITDIYKRPSSINYRNDGHGTSISFNFPDGVQPRISGGPLGRNSYILHNIHIHWKSEHKVNNHRFDAEMHLVHFNSKYGSLEQALQFSDGVAVLGVLYYASVNKICFLILISITVRRCQ